MRWFPWSNRLPGLRGARGGVRASWAIMVLLLSLLAQGACESVATEPDTSFVRTEEGLEYRAWTEILESYPIQLRTNVRIRNTSSSDVNMTFPDGCVVLVRAYRENGTAPVWDQANNTGCTGALVPLHLEPGDSVTYVSATGARAILGDSLPDGLYRLEAYLRPDSGPVTLDAGTVPLAVPRP